jgi:hypothetical protein
MAKYKDGEKFISKAKGNVLEIMYEEVRETGEEDEIEWSEITYRVKITTGERTEELIVSENTIDVYYDSMSKLSIGKYSIGQKFESKTEQNKFLQITGLDLQRLNRIGQMYRVKMWEGDGYDKAVESCVPENFISDHYVEAEREFRTMERFDHIIEI